MLYLLTQLSRDVSPTRWMPSWENATGPLADALNWLYGSSMRIGYIGLLAALELCLEPALAAPLKVSGPFALAGCRLEGLG